MAMTATIRRKRYAAVSKGEWLHSLVKDNKLRESETSTARILAPVCFGSGVRQTREKFSLQLGTISPNVTTTCSALEILHRQASTFAFPRMAELALVYTDIAVVGLRTPCG